MSANSYQVGGTHYESTIQHWDYVVANDLDYFQAQITKYVTRWKKKNGLRDLQKAKHFLEKYMEVVQIQLKQQEDVKNRKTVTSTGMLHPFGYHEEQELGHNSD